MGQASPAFQAAVAPGKKNTWIAIVTALAMILAIFLGLSASGLLKFGATSPKIDTLKAEGQNPKQDILRAEGQNPTVPLLSAQGSTPPPILDRRQATMPDDVRKWLEHLERIEKRKNDLSLKQLSQMAVLAQRMKVLGGGESLLSGDPTADDGPAPSDTAKDSFDQLRPEWNQLIADFRSDPPPAECKPIADDFGRAVQEIPGINADLADILSGASSDPSKALEKVYKIQNTSTTVIDKYFGSCDDKIGDVCRKYETRKWFGIKTDVGGGLMGKFGM
jgi:hypothetical protein